jgi:hypothetical protein
MKFFEISFHRNDGAFYYSLPPGGRKLYAVYILFWIMGSPADKQRFVVDAVKVIKKLRWDCPIV